MTPTLMDLKRAIAGHLTLIEELFRREYKPEITLIVRMTNAPAGFDGDVLMTSDPDLEQAIATARRLNAERPKT